MIILFFFFGVFKINYTTLSLCITSSHFTLVNQRLYQVHDNDKRYASFRLLFLTSTSTSLLLISINEVLYSHYYHYYCNYYK